jgi:hypothetical protein
LPAPAARSSSGPPPRPLPRPREGGVISKSNRTGIAHPSNGEVAPANSILVRRHGAPKR